MKINDCNQFILTMQDYIESYNNDTVSDAEIKRGADLFEQLNDFILKNCNDPFQGERLARLSKQFYMNCGKVLMYMRKKNFDERMKKIKKENPAEYDEILLGSYSIATEIGLDKDRGIELSEFEKKRAKVIREKWKNETENLLSQFDNL